jgi:hypothetical protein
MRARFAAGLLICGLAGAAVAEPRVRFRAGFEPGVVVSPREDGRRDAAGFVDLVPSAVLRVAPGWRLAVGAGIPVAPILNVQLPIALERAPAGRGLLLRVAARPIYARVDLCASGRCPLDEAAPPRDRGGDAAGLLGEVGLGYRFAIRTPRADPDGGDAAPWLLDLRAGYLGGGWLHRGGDRETPLGGLWQGFTLGVDLMF